MSEFDKKYSVYNPAGVGKDVPMKPLSYYQDLFRKAMNHDFTAIRAETKVERMTIDPAYTGN